MLQIYKITNIKIKLHSERNKLIKQQEVKCVNIL